ncbi:MAG: hypothetical protein J1D85_06090 [Bacteroidales bacterium]|nr:hypothetical protein [Bacteroidales bacterium]
MTTSIKSSVIQSYDLEWKEWGAITVCASDGSKIHGSLFVTDIKKRLIYKFVFTSFGDKREELNVNQNSDYKAYGYNAFVIYCNKIYYLNVPAW